MLRIRLGVGLPALLVASSLYAGEVRIVRFATPTQNSTAPPCPVTFRWESHTFFLNTTDAIQEVTALGVSNGGPLFGPLPLRIPPHQAVSMFGVSGLGWEPPSQPPLWVNRLNVPDGVLTSSQIQAWVGEPDIPVPPCTGRGSRHGGLPLPEFATLTPPGIPQYHLGLDTGNEFTDLSKDARLNVGIYNGAQVPATAVIRIYCADEQPPPIGPNKLLSELTISIPPDTIVQPRILGSTKAAGCPYLSDRFEYATVTVDQPSFSYAVELSNDSLPKFPGTVAFTY